MFPSNRRESCFDSRIFLLWWGQDGTQLISIDFNGNVSAQLSFQTTAGTQKHVAYKRNWRCRTLASRSVLWKHYCCLQVAGDSNSHKLGQNPEFHAVFSPEAKLVHGHRQVSRLTETLVDITVIHGDQVHIAEDETLIVVLLQGLHVTHIQQLGSVKGLVSILRDKNTTQWLIAAAGVWSKGRELRSTQTGFSHTNFLFMTNAYKNTAKQYFMWFCGQRDWCTFIDNNCWH